MKYIFRFTSIIIISIILQFAYFMALAIGISTLSPYLFFLLTVMGILCALFIASGEDSIAYRFAWILPMLIFPAVFGIIYLFYNRRALGRRAENSIVSAKKRADMYIQKSKSGENIKHYSSKYIENTSGFSLSFGGESKYYSRTEELNKDLLIELKKAQKYIFIEMYIIEEGIMWDEILIILIQKVCEGVDVRIIYDGKGSFFTLPYFYYKKLRKSGIKCIVFNPFRLFISNRFNTSSHRKIISIDGKTAFSGGFNFADEYINKKVGASTGHWKDSGFMTGDSTAWNYTLMFLVMWEFLSRERVNYKKLMPVMSSESTPDTSVWCDFPLDCEPVSERLYLSLIMGAKKYLYITTPYLIPPDSILTALCTAARTGIDVRIILPFIADKFVINTITKTNYRALLEAGVRIYEYAPGFIHAKNLVSDDAIAAVGTLNLDFRSFYMNYECGACFYSEDIIYAVKSDFIETLASCEEICLQNLNKLSVFVRAFRRFFRLFAPLS